MTSSTVTLVTNYHEYLSYVETHMVARTKRLRL